MSKANAKRLTFHEKNQTDCNSGRPYMLNSSVGSDVEPVEKKKKKVSLWKVVVWIVLCRGKIQSDNVFHFVSV